jgi:chemotaxis protein CheX
MGERQDRDEHSAVLTLPRIMDLRAATPLATELLGLRGRHLTLEASLVEQLGAQCLQVLLSAQLTWGRDGMAISLANPSQAFRETFETLGAPVGTIGEWETIQ